MPKNSPIPTLAPEVKAWRDLVKPMKRYGISLLNQQIWCWGYDIREGGNALLRYGFVQFRQEKSCGGSVYSLQLDDGALLRLWGGNVLYHVEGVGALHLKRYEFEPRLMPYGYVLSYAPPEGSGTPQDGEACGRAAQLASACMGWIADYERWVLATVGYEHRHRSVQVWKQNALFLIQVEQMAVLWDEYARGIAAYSATLEPYRHPAS
jgi:hypothetical protein